MKIATIVAAAAFYSLAFPAKALFYKDYADIESRSTDIAESLLTTMGQSYLWANAILNRRGDNRLYCPPPKLRLGGETYRTIVTDYVTENPQEPNSSIELIFLLAMIDQFPCPAKVP